MLSLPLQVTSFKDEETQAQKDDTNGPILDSS